jgi:hypothetical protein
MERMLRIYFLQQWFNLSDPSVKKTLYDSAGMRQFVGIDLGCQPVPDETTVYSGIRWNKTNWGTDPGLSDCSASAGTVCLFNLSPAKSYC